MLLMRKMKNVLEEEFKFGLSSDISSHAKCRDVECAFLATKRAAALARDHDHRLHIVHLTSAKEADWMVQNKGSLDHDRGLHSAPNFRSG